MGFELSWFAVRGISGERVRELLELEPTGTREEIPESALVGGALPLGWYLAVASSAAGRGDSTRFFFDGPSALATALSHEGEMISCIVQEFAMYSGAVAWKAGRIVWSVIHDSEQGLDHLAVTGAPHDALAAIRAAAKERMTTSTRDVDYTFDVPLELAKQITGYVHYEIPDGHEGGFFDVLKPKTR